MALGGSARWESGRLSSAGCLVGVVAECGCQGRAGGACRNDQGGRAGGAEVVTVPAGAGRGCQGEPAGGGVVCQGELAEAGEWLSRVIGWTPGWPAC
jgi:hypothetical protein